MFDVNKEESGKKKQREKNPKPNQNKKHSKTLLLNKGYCAYQFVFISLNSHFIARHAGIMSCRQMTANTSGKFVDKLALGKVFFPHENKIR